MESPPPGECDFTWEEEDMALPPDESYCMPAVAQKGAGYAIQPSSSSKSESTTTPDIASEMTAVHPAAQAAESAKKDVTPSNNLSAGSTLTLSQEQQDVLELVKTGKVYMMMKRIRDTSKKVPYTH